MTFASVALYDSGGWLTIMAAAKSVNRQVGLLLSRLNLKIMEKPIFSEKVITPTRIYYVDVNEDSKGGRYMTLREIPSPRITGDGEAKKPQRVFFHSKEWKKIKHAINEAASYLQASDKNDRKCK